jgi:hypothetical protein
LNELDQPQYTLLLVVESADLKFVGSNEDEGPRTYLSLASSVTSAR